MTKLEITDQIRDWMEKYELDASYDPEDEYFYFPAETKNPLNQYGVCVLIREDFYCVISRFPLVAPDDKTPQVLELINGFNANNSAGALVLSRDGGMITFRLHVDLEGASELSEETIRNSLFIGAMCLEDISRLLVGVMFDFMTVDEAYDQFIRMTEQANTDGSAISHPLTREEYLRLEFG